MVIRSEQMRALSAACEANFDRRLASYLRSTHPESFREWDEAAMAEYIEQTRDLAKQHDLYTERGMAALAELRVLYGNDFHEREPWATEILNDHETDAARRVNELQWYIDEAPVPHA